MYILDYWLCLLLIIQRFKTNVRAFASQRSVKKSRKKGKTEKTDTAVPEKYLLSDDVNPDYVEDSKKNISLLDTSEAGTSVPMIPSRGSVLQACIITSGFIGLLGVVIREVHFFSQLKDVTYCMCSYFENNMLLLFVCTSRVLCLHFMW